MTELSFGVICMIVFSGTFALCLYLSDVILNFFYNSLPGFRKWFDRFCNISPDDEDEEVFYYE